MTGANGFIGSAVAADLVSRGFSVTAASRTIPAIRGVAYFPIEKLDGGTDWRPALPNGGVIVHLAARAHMLDETAADAEFLYHMTNSEATARLARQAAQSGVKRLIFASSIKVNGEVRDKPYTENDPPAPIEAYGRSKAEAEAELKRIAAETGLEIVILRLTIVYGPGVKANFRNLIAAVDCGLPLPLGAVNNRRSMIFIGNLCDLIATIIGNDAAAGRTFLVSDGDDVSTPELITLIAQAFGKKPRLLPLPAGLIRYLAGMLGREKEATRLLGSLSVDSTSLRDLIGWTAPFGVADGIRQTVKWYRSAQR